MNLNAGMGIHFESPKRLNGDIINRQMVGIEFNY